MRIKKKYSNSTNNTFSDEIASKQIKWNVLMNQIRIISRLKTCHTNHNTTIIRATTIQIIVNFILLINDNYLNYFSCETVLFMKNGFHANRSEK